MTYRYKISLPGLKGFGRTYDLDGANTLHQFSKQMVYDMDFPLDQIVLFKAYDAEGNLVARYATVNIGDGSIDRITVAQQVKAGIVRYDYFYDTTNKYSVIVTLSEEPATAVTKPTLVDSKGPNPEDFRNGYVAFEDLRPEKQLLPDDEDYEDEEDADVEDDDDDDEDFKEEYDENEEER